MSAHKIYIVEDEAILAADLSLRLRKMGYEVVGMGLDGAEALADIPRLQPDLVLMDIHLGAGQDGIQVSKQLRDQWEGPIIYLTSYIDDITLSRAKQANAAAYLVKPFLDTNEIKANIEVALHRHEMQQQARKSNMVLQQTLKGLQDAVVVLDENSKTVLVNPAAKTMLDLTDYGEDELSIMNLRKQFQTTYNGVAIDALSDAEWSAFARQRAAEGPFKVQTLTPKGNTLFLEVSPTLMPKLGEEGFLYIMTLRDLNAQDLITSPVSYTHLTLPTKA
jgi:DNA-binding response OmpR family regulator